jgi:hypothetical protein
MQSYLSIDDDTHDTGFHQYNQYSIDKDGNIIYTGKSYVHLVNGRKHCLDAPAVTFDDSIGMDDQWWINGHCVTVKLRRWAKERDIDLDNLSDLDKAVIALEWGNYSG